jgi:heterodisulfide reductase subunit A2
MPGSTSTFSKWPTFAISAPGFTAEPEAATEKAKDLTRMAVAKVALLQPLRNLNLSIKPKALIIGGGVAGMAAAKALSAQGYPSLLVEQSERLGGQARAS